MNTAFVCKSSGEHAFENGRCRDCGEFEKDLPASSDGGQVASAGEVATPPRFVKKFLVQFESGADTRWICDDKETAHCLKFTAGLIATSHTEGPVPGVTILREL